MFAENAIISWLLAHWGAAGGVLSMAVLAAYRFLPPYLQGLRERRLAALNARTQASAAISQREHDLFKRIDKKDEVLEKLTGNHIQHLEMQLAKSDQFHDTAIEHLRQMTHDLRELRGQVHEIRDLSIKIDARMQQ